VSLYERALRPLLFRLPADRAHDLAHLALRWPMPWRLVAQRATPPDPRLASNLAGLALSTPIGLAPGFDKNADRLDSLATLGFGYLCVGSITTLPRQGNPRPRLHRYPERQSLANCMGMPNLGLDAAVRRLRRRRAPGWPPVIASVAGFSAEELLRATAAIEPYVDAVEIGLRCRHTPETSRMADLEVFTPLAEGLPGVTRKRVFVKLPPHHDAEERELALAMVDVCVRVGLAGVSVSGTREVQEPRLSMGLGGIAGRATHQDALRIVRDVAERAEGRLAIKAAGGVFSGRHALAMLRAGAHAVEVYSAFIYRGWDAPRLIARELAQALDKEGIASPRELARQPAAVI
jgi:dihydroorotate dehydrogenase (fumarate)/dihydroorotate dehydrogenase